MELHAINDTDAAAVDWWFIYKLPCNVPFKAEVSSNAGTSPASDGPAGRTTGWEYLYADAAGHGLPAMSPNRLDRQEGALHRTLAPLFQTGSDNADSVGWICYNDEIPGRSSLANDANCGHTKGVLAFDIDTDTAFWLLHSWPKFPDLNTNAPGSPDYAQTYLCITLKDVETARYIAEQMYHRQEPQTYDCRIPSVLPSDDIFNRLAKAVDVNETDPPCDITFFSRGGQDFRLLAKNRHWGRDFWIDHVGPHLKSNIDVETWRRGTVPGTADEDHRHHATDILYIDFASLGLPCEWHYTKDHAKWAVSEQPDWVCVADINRQTSQELRGGGAICFRNHDLWQALRGIEKLVE